jgi:hypothetical protein
VNITCFVRLAGNMIPTTCITMINPQKFWCICYIWTIVVDKTLSLCFCLKHHLWFATICTHFCFLWFHIYVRINFFCVLWYLFLAKLLIKYKYNFKTELYQYGIRNR